MTQTDARGFAEELLIECGTDFDYMSVYEMFPDLTDEEIRQVLKEADSAEIVVKWND